MAIKKFKVMASNAKKKTKSDGSCIPKSMRKNVKSGCTKKSVKSTRYSDVRPYEERKYWYFTTHGVGPGTIPKDLHVLEIREGQNRKGTWGDYVLLDGVLNTDELKTYDMIELSPLDSACTKKSIKSGRFLFPWEVEGEFADGYRYTAKGDSEAECIERLISMQDKHGELVWYSGTDDEYYDAGRRIDSSCTKKSVKADWASNGKKKKIFKSFELDNFFLFELGRDFIGLSINNSYPNGTAWIGARIIKCDDAKGLFAYLQNELTNNVTWYQIWRTIANSGFDAKIDTMGNFISDRDMGKPIKSSKGLTVPKSKIKNVKASKTSDMSVKEFNNKYGDEWEIKAIDTDSPYYEDYHFQLYHIVDSRKSPNASFMTVDEAEDYIANFNKDRTRWENVEFSTSVKEFGVKASALAKRKAQQRITAAESNGLERAKQYIVDAYNNENWDSEDMTVDEYFKNEDLHKVGLVYTTLGDNNEYDYQISVDLIDPKVFVEVDNEVVYEEPYSSIDALIEDLQDFDWDNWYSYYIHKLPEKYDDVIFSSCANGAKSIKCWDNGNDVWEYQESYDNYYDEEPPEHIGKELERLAKLTDKYMNMWFDKFEELHPNERYSNVYDFPDVDEAVGFTRDAAEYYPDQIEIGASKNVNAGITVGQDDRYDFSNPIYELDDYVKALADGVVNQINDITYDISKETIAFFDADNNIVFVQPIGGIIPEPEDLETDIDELSSAIRSEMDRSYAEVNWESDEDDPDYASRAVEFSEDIGEVDIDDLEPITGDGEDIDYGFGFDSNGDPIDESTVEELERIAQEILDKSEIHNIDEYADLHNFNYYASIPYIQESFNIAFTYVADIYELSKRSLVNDDGIFTTVAPYNIHFNVRCNNGEVEYAECTDVDVNDGYVKDVELKNFNLDALVQFATDLVNPVTADIYNATTNI